MNIVDNVTAVFIYILPDAICDSVMQDIAWKCKSRYKIAFLPLSEIFKVINLVSAIDNLHKGVIKELPSNFAVAMNVVDDFVSDDL